MRRPRLYARRHLRGDRRLDRPVRRLGWNGETPGGGRSRVAADLALSGRVLDAEAALDVRLVSRIVDDPRDVADEIAANDDDSVRAIADLLRDPGDRSTQEERERVAFADLVAKRDADGG